MPPRSLEWHGADALGTRSALAAILLVAFVNSVAAAQTSRRIVDGHCECKLEFRTAARITDAGTSGFLGPFSLITRDSRGRHYIVSTVTPGQITVVDSTGAFLTTVGRSGDGPGELRSPLAPIFDSSDNLYVVDRRQRRLSVFDPGYEFVTSVQIPRMSSAVLTNDGTLVVAGNVRTTDRSAYPLHVISPRDGLTRSFGARSPQPRPEVPADLERVIAPAGDGGIWLAHPQRYQIEHWSLENELSTELIREVDWFPDVAHQRTTGSATQPPQTSIAALWESEGLLYVVMHAPDTDRRLQPGIEPGKPLDFSNFHNLFDTVIEVIDLDQGTVLVSHRESRYLRIVSAGYIFDYTESPEGVPTVSILQLTFQRT